MSRARQRKSAAHSNDDHHIHHGDDVHGHDHVDRSNDD
jgi:hypothetical protein